jgi:hypothetical protein
VDTLPIRLCNNGKLLCLKVNLIPIIELFHFCFDALYLINILLFDYPFTFVNSIVTINDLLKVIEGFSDGSFLCGC